MKRTFMPKCLTKAKMKHKMQLAAGTGHRKPIRYTERAMTA